MAYVTPNSTATLEASTSVPSGFISAVCKSITSKLPIRFSCVQQVHVKLKAEAAVMFVFYILKRLHAYCKSWLSNREEAKAQQIKDKTKVEKRRKRTRRHKRRMVDV
jgi:hypothetical protein